MERTLRQPLHQASAGPRGCVAAASLTRQDVHSNSLVWRVRNTSDTDEMCREGEEEKPR